ncbi:MAG: hypothetical protein E7472_01195 [Ruminococcaceae bacterium]|nr:hypothetical protein [Oscillospiraceae bacterium]
MNMAQTLKNYIKDRCDLDLVGIASAAALDGEPEGHRCGDLLPGAKSIIVFGRALSDGAMQAMFRAHENKKIQAQSSYAAYCDDLAPNFLLVNDCFNICNYIEQTYGAVAMPLPFNVQQSMVPDRYPGKYFADPYGQGMPLDIWKAAMAAGLGEFGWSNRFLTPEYGPRQMLCAVLTTLELESDVPYAGEKLCNPASCGICAAVCPVGAIAQPCGGCTSEKSVAGKSVEVGAIKANACAVAALGMRKEFQGRVPVPDLIMDNDPGEDALAAAFEKKPVNGLSIEHYPRYLCERCLIYCPVGGWKARFADTGFSAFKPEDYIKG